MTLLLRSPQWRRCLQGTVATGQRQLFCCSALVSEAAPGAPDKPFESIQNPTQTRDAYSGGQQPPGTEDDSVEREVKWGKNIPASVEQAKEELKYANKGLAESVEMGVNVLLSKAKDTVAAAQRAVGLEPARGPEMSQGTMGAAGKMEHAPPGTKSGFDSVPRSGDLAQAKYDEIADTEKPNFPKGEQSVNELFPDMKVAASEQSNTPQRQRAENKDIRRELHGGSSAHEPGADTGGMQDTAQDILSENLHNKGP